MIIQRELLEKHFQLRVLQTGDYFVKEGQYPKQIGFVESGLLYAYQIDSKGEMVTTNFFQANSFCGSYYGFYKQAPSLESIKTITETKIYTISYNNLQTLLSEDLTFNQIGRLAIEQVCISKDIRISKMLKLDAKERYLWFITEYPLVFELSPQKLIASYLGMKPESLSRIRRELIS